MVNSTSKLTPYGRELLVRRIRDEGHSIRAAARAQGVSHTWAAVIWHRFAAEGEAAFQIRSSRPHRSPRRTRPCLARRIERARRRLRVGPQRLAWALGLPRSTVYAVLRRAGLAQLRVFRAPRPPFRRYEREHAGDLLHVDVKELGRLGAGGGKRFGPVRQSQRRGTEYHHVCVDDHSRVRYREKLPSQDASACAGFMARAIEHFRALGVERVRQVMTDNHFSYSHSRAFAEVLAANGTQHLLIPPYTPRWNGKVEAAIKIMLRETAYARPYTSNRARSIALARSDHSYNQCRPHGSLGGLTPMKRLLDDVNKVRGRNS